MQLPGNHSRADIGRMLAAARVDETEKRRAYDEAQRRFDSLDRAFFRGDRELGVQRNDADLAAHQAAVALRRAEKRVVMLTKAHRGEPLTIDDLR
jgi:hypothetical protein